MRFTQPERCIAVIFFWRFNKNGISMSSEELRKIVIKCGVIICSDEKENKMNRKISGSKACRWLILNSGYAGLAIIMNLIIIYGW